ncbi:MAG: hypothetical protein ACE5GH_05820, partial [Fidelibacterota bacterium]
PGFDVRGDGIVSALERLAAETVGKEDALFCPTCMMANQIATTKRKMVNPPRLMLGIFISLFPTMIL